MTLGLVAVDAGPAHAALVYNVAGNFAGDARVEVFQYRAGGEADYMYQFNKTDTVTADFYSYTVNGTFEPFVGDFDADGYDELFWYAPGSGQDYIWNFTSLTSYTSTAVTVSGTFRPVTGDFTGDTYEDILWHTPGTALDYLWDYDAGGYTSHDMTFNGTYVPTSGTFNPADGADDVVFWAPGTTTDYLIDFEPGAIVYSSTTVGPVNGTDYLPFALDSRGDDHDDVFWYLPGTGVDPYWNFKPAGGYDNLTYEVDGTYSRAGGDLFNDGYDDALWQGTLTTIWDWHNTPTGLVRTIWTLGSSLAAPDAAEGQSGTLTFTEVETTPEPA